MSSKPLLHLIGRDPISGKTFIPKLGLNDVFWETTTEDVCIWLHYPRAIGSVPKEDIQTLWDNSSNPEESLKALSFILRKSDLHLEFDKEDERPQEDRIFPASYHSHPIGASYNIALRLIEALSPEIWCAALPDYRGTEVLRNNRILTEEENKQKLPKWLSDKIVDPEEVRPIFGPEIKKLGPIPEFEGDLHIFTSIGLKVQENTWNLPDDQTFVCLQLDKDDRMQNTGKRPFIIANPAYLALLEKNPKAARELYREALGDAFHYQSQDSDQRYFDSDCFYLENPEEIQLLVQTEEAHQLTIKRESKALIKAARKIVASYLPHLEPSITRKNQDTKFHLKEISFVKNELSLTATVQTPKETHKLSLRHGKMDIQSEHRNRGN